MLRIRWICPAVLAMALTSPLLPARSCLAAAPHTAKNDTHDVAIPKGADAGAMRRNMPGETAAPHRNALHGHAWAFGKSASGGEALWHEGIPAERLRKQAVEKGRAPSKGASAAGTNEKATANKKGELGLSWEKKSTGWRGNLLDGNPRPDEELSLETHHKVRAFADVKTAADLSISVGPELILKDEQRSPYGVNESQPDSVLGMGMQFKYDF